MHTVLSNENGKFYTTMIYPCFSRSVCFSMGSPAWWRFGLSSSGSSLMSRWCDTPLVRKFQMWHSRCKKIDLCWFQGCQMHFWWMWSTVLWKKFLNISGPTVWYSKYLTRALLHPIFSSLLAPATACESQATACDIKITLDMVWIGVNCIFKENISSMYWSISFLNLKIFYFNFYNIFICTTCKHFTL